jgi:transketolase
MSDSRIYTELAKLAGPVRHLILSMTNSAKSSHIGSCFSVVDLLICVYSYADKDPENKIILSKGHAAAAMYAVLSKFGKLKENLNAVYGVDGEKFSGHVSHFVHEDISLSTGSLGHGLPYGAGISLAKKKEENTGKVFVIMSDGEMDEGTTWESALFANHFRLNNLIVFIDRNRLQSLSDTESTIRLEPLKKKWKSFGWQTYEVNAHSYKDLMKLTGKVIANQKKPVCIIANSIKGYGISFMENSVKWHYKSPNDDELDLGILELKDKFE